MNSYQFKNIYLDLESLDLDPRSVDDINDYIDAELENLQDLITIDDINGFRSCSETIADLMEYRQIITITQRNEDDHL